MRTTSVSTLRVQFFFSLTAGKYNLAEWDVHVITGAMKLFFRELKDPVIDPHTLEKIYSVLGMIVWYSLDHNSTPTWIQHLL